MSNIHSQTIPPDVIAQALEKMNEAYIIIRPYLHTLSNDERETILKMGDKSLALVEKTSELAGTNPEFAPTYFNLEDLNIDLTDALSLRALENRAQQITREISDTMMLAGNEAFTQSLMYYNGVKRAVHDKVAGAQAVYDELKKRYPVGRPKKSSNNE
jgi:hypothetical protein